MFQDKHRAKSDDYWVYGNQTRQSRKVTAAIVQLIH